MLPGASERAVKRLLAVGQYPKRSWRACQFVAGLLRPFDSIARPGACRSRRPSVKTLFACSAGVLVGRMRA